jgi:hypothetical protein
MLEINILCLPLDIRYNPECEDQRENLQIIDKIMMSSSGQYILTDRCTYKAPTMKQITVISHWISIL